jgi:PAS domain S-box-containing protein
MIAAEEDSITRLVSAPSSALDSDLWKGALDAAAEGITISDPSQPDNPIIYANGGFERMTGYDARQVVGRNCRFLQGSDTDAEAVAQIRRAVEQRREVTVELLNYRKTGEPFWNRLSIRPLRDTSGEVSHFIGIQSDVTRRRTAEENLRRAKEDLEAAYRDVRASLAAAASIQQALLPSKVPNIEGLDFRWVFKPCDELAGDGLNVIPLDERHVAFYVLDVKGHGLPAALLSVTLSRLLSPLGEESILYTSEGSGIENPRAARPSRVLERLNGQLPFEPKTSQFFTIFYGVFDRSTLELTYASAGHPPGIIVSPSGSPRVLEATGFPVGIVPEPSYEDRRAQLAQADRLVVYTDGLTETENRQEEEFGPKRLLAMLDATSRQPLATSLKVVVEAVEQWNGKKSLPDDLSVLALEVKSSA